MEPMDLIPPIRVIEGMRPLVSVETVAALLDVSSDYLQVGLREGRFPGKRIGRLWRMPTDFVRGFLAAPAGAQFEEFAAEWMAEDADKFAAESAA